jgi:hypothetical protein
LSLSDPIGVVGPVRYLTDALTYVPANDFVRSAFNFIETVASEDEGLISDHSALRAQIKTLTDEQADPNLASWRRLEAQLGYDVDEAPEILLSQLSRLAEKYGEAAVSEAALATHGADAAAVLHAEIDFASERHWQCDLSRTAELVSDVELEPGAAPWKKAERAAAAVRLATGYATGPLSNFVLGEILGVRPAAFKSEPIGKRVDRAYGIRLNTGRKRGEVVSLVTNWSADRRFEFARALGDAIWTRGQKLGLITRAKSERQKFQRAFAQSLLCPYNALIAYVGQDVTDGAISAAARHFLVSERVIRTVLVNKHRLSRLRLNETLMLYPAEAEALDQAVEAA